MPDLDLTRLPSGQLGWLRFVEAIAEVDDRAERYFLEMKSQADLNTAKGQAIVAKFILAAANRDQQQASRRFGGYALMVLGVAQDATPGIAAFEAKDLALTVGRLIGADGPSWDFERVRVDDNDVIVIVVDPPTGEIWTCRGDGDGLVDGGIYVRADGETRRASGDEIRTMLARRSARGPDVDIEVKVVGPATALHCDEQVVEEHIERERARLLAAYGRAADVKDGSSSGIGSFMLSRPDGRRKEEYEEEIEEWARSVRDSWSDVLDDVTAVLAKPACLQITNHEQTFLEDVEVRVYLSGAVEALDRETDEDADVLARLPRPPRAWGPRPDAALASLMQTPYIPSIPSWSPPIGGPGGVSFENGGSVWLTMSLATLRPRQTFESDSDEIVLVVRGTPPDQVTGHWTATAKGHHRVFEGTVSVEVAPCLDLTDGMREILSPED